MFGVLLLTVVVFLVWFEIIPVRKLYYVVRAKVICFFINFCLELVDLWDRAIKYFKELWK